MFQDLFLKLTINKHLKKLSGPMLNKIYFELTRKNPKSHIDNVYIRCCINELKKRGKM